MKDQHEKDHLIRVDDDGLLTIDVVHPRHAGVYQCLAANSHGTLHSTVTIEVTR